MEKYFAQRGVASYKETKYTYSICRTYCGLFTLHINMQAVSADFHVCMHFVEGLQPAELEEKL